MNLKFIQMSHRHKKKKERKNDRVECLEIKKKHFNVTLVTVSV